MRTELCDRLGIEFPIFAFTHCRDVVAAVSKAGGMGVLGAVGFSPERLEMELDWIDGREVGRLRLFRRRDVALLRDLFDHAHEHGHLLFRSRRGGRVRVPLRFSVDELVERARAERGRGAAAR